MTLAASCLWTLARTIVLCLFAWPVCWAIERWLRGLSDSQRPWILGAVLAPFCFPELLVGYAFRDLALAHPRWAEALCSGLLFIRMIPVGAIALLAAPAGSLDVAAFHCRRMLLRTQSDRRGQWLELGRCYWHGPVLRALPALALMGLVAFQEFELAALLMTASWTDWFIAAQRVGLEQRELLRQTLWPALLQLPLLLGVTWWLRRTALQQRNETAGGDDGMTSGSTGRAVCWFAATFVAIALAAGCLAPLAMMGGRTIDGLALLFRQRTQQLGLAREIITAGAVALCAGLTVWFTSARLASAAPPASHWNKVGVILLLPGLFGSLLLSLGTVSVFQQSWLRPIYDTPLPWVLALTLWLLPRAAVLRLWLNTMRRDEAVHLAEMLNLARGEGRGTRNEERSDRSSSPLPLVPLPSALLWRLRDQPRFLAAGLLCYWAYGDLSTACLLAPTGMTSGLVRLYNFMHYGRSAALSAEACLFFVAPLVSVGLVLFVLRAWRR